MIAILEQTIRNIPCLVVTKKGKCEAPLPTIIYYHGFTSAKEHNLPLAYLLAQEDFRVILPDSLNHGNRTENISKQAFQLSFWDVVIKNIEELQKIKQYLDEEELIANGQIGIAGTSMGGITTSAALRKFPWVKVGAVLMGSPKVLAFANELITIFENEHSQTIDKDELQSTFNTLEQLDLSKDISALQERPLFFWHGDADGVVPFEHSYSFYKEAQNHYTDTQLLQFSREEGRDHKVSRSAILDTVAWFRKHLKT